MGTKRTDEPRAASHAAYRKNRKLLAERMRKKGYVTPQEAASQLGGGLPTIRRYIQKGTLKSKTTGGAGIRSYRWITQASLNKLLGRMS